MSPKCFVEEILAAIDGIFFLDDQSREVMRTFLLEQIYWGEKIHIIGRKNFRATLRAQALDSIYLLNFVVATVLGKNSDGKKEPSSDWKSLGKTSIPEVNAPAEGEGSAWSGIKVVDVGTGYGFPGMVWKIAVPEMDITLFERKEKVSTFLERLVAKLGIRDLDIECCDASSYPEKEKFDIMVSKAAGRLAYIFPVADRLLRRDGCYITIKTRNWQWELPDSEERCMELIESKHLPGNRGEILLFSRKKEILSRREA